MKTNIYASPPRQQPANNGASARNVSHPSVSTIEHRFDAIA